ncbi:MAG: hypothetical protein AVDCRST_MAG50-2634, partial [uncultured Acidimicrobiales bacterium]
CPIRTTTTPRSSRPRASPPCRTPSTRTRASSRRVTTIRGPASSASLRPRSARRRRWPTASSGRSPRSPPTTSTRRTPTCPWVACPPDGSWPRATRTWTRSTTRRTSWRPRSSVTVTRCPPRKPPCTSRTSR